MLFRSYYQYYEKLGFEKNVMNAISGDRVSRLCARLTGYNIDIRPESGYYGEEEPKAAEAEKTEDTAAE